MDALVVAVVVFLAELGDKTQLLAMSLATRYRPLPVLLGIAIGFGACNLVSVVVGGALGAALPTTALRIGGGLMFLLFAWLALRGAEHDDAAPDVRPGAVVRSVATAIFVAELGDKTMLTTATLATERNPVLTWIGATVGIVACGALAVAAGRKLGERLAPSTTKVISVVLFAGFGLLLLVDGLRSL